MPRLAALGLALLVLCTRLAHAPLLWVEEAYPLAAAQQLLRGRVLYQDIWFDKPPLYAWVYLLWGAQTGWPLRVAGAVFVLLACYLLYRLAASLLDAQAALLAAFLLAFFLTFDIPAAVMALAPDLLLIVPHLAAVYFAVRGRPMLSGLMVGVGLQCNTKAVFVLLACLPWVWRALGRYAVGVLVPCAAVAVYLYSTGAWANYVEQVWVWGAQYSRDTYFAHPWREGLQRTAHWSGFHAALLLGIGLWCCRWKDRWPWLAWLGWSLIAVWVGLRFFPRYYFQLLPAACLLAAWGWQGQRRAVALCGGALLCVPLFRFGPRYVQLAAAEAQQQPIVWSDLAMAQDSFAAAELINRQSRPADTLLVWGYRPELFPYTRLAAATRFLDSQPLTGVLADRHLAQNTLFAPELAARHRAELVRSAPTWIVDGLGPFNPPLAIGAYPDLASWLQHYRLAARTRTTLIYRRNE